MLIDSGKNASWSYEGKDEQSEEEVLQTVQGEGQRVPEGVEGEE